MKRSVGAKDRTNEAKASRNPFASLFHSRRGNERPSGIQSQTEDKEMAGQTISLPSWAIDGNNFTRTAATATPPEFNDNRDDTDDPVAEIIRSLNEFIASVTIPPPPPPPLPPSLQGSQMVPRLPPNCSHARDVISGQSNFPPQQNFGLNEVVYDLSRDTLMQSVVQRQHDRTIFSNGRGDSKQSINLLLPPRQQSSENFSSQSEIDFSKLVIPPPPLDTPSPKSILKVRKSGTFYSDHDCRLNSAMAAQRRPKLPPAPPLPPLLTPPPLVRQLPSLPPLHPSRSRLTGRSPSLSPRASSAGGSLGRASFSRFPPSRKLPPPGFSEDPVGLPEAESQGSEDAVYVDSKKHTDGIIVNDRRNAEMERDSSFAKKQINRQNNDDSSTTSASLQRRIIVEPRAVTLSRAYNSVGTFSRATPPVPPPRLTSSVNCSPVAKRPVRRVSFDECPPSTPSDKECVVDRRKQNSDRNETNNNHSPHRLSSFTKSSSDATTDGSERQKPATAQIRPNALRSSSSLGFHGVIGDGEGPPGGSRPVSSSSTGIGGRVARSGSVDSAPSRAGTSVFTALRAKLKSYWSPSMSRRKASLPGGNDPCKTELVASAGLDPVEGNPKDRNTWRRGRKGSSKERLNANVDSRSIVNNRSSSTDGEDECLEFYRELKQTIPKAFKTFNGQRI